MLKQTRFSFAQVKVLEALFWSGSSSRALLAEETGFSRSKINTTLASLFEENYVKEVGEAPSSGGRRPESLSLTTAFGYLAAIDLGATSLDVALFDPAIMLLARETIPIVIAEGPLPILAKARALLEKAMASAKITPKDLAAIGMGVPGPIEFDTGTLVSPPIMPGWSDFSVKEALEKNYRVPVFVDNDVNVMAFGELWRMGRAVPNFLLIKIGTGIGCGIVCHGMVYRGSNGAAGDVGHICIAPNGMRCHCGNDGCVEVFAAGPAMSRQAVEAANSGKSVLLKEILDDKGALTPEDIAQASHAGDVAANAIIKAAGNAIGQMLATIINFFNPSHVLIGGGIAQTGPLLLASIRQSVYQRSLALSTRHLEIQYAPLGEEAGIYGAAVMAAHESLQMLAKKTEGAR